MQSSLLGNASRALLLLLVALPSAAALCPLSLGAGGKLPAGHPPVLSQLQPRRTAAPGFSEARGGTQMFYPRAELRVTQALAAVDFKAVKADLLAVFTNSQPWWPADYGAQRTR